jgi:glycosyltransferase involved in cell wall biosynthesis
VIAGPDRGGRRSGEIVAIVPAYQEGPRVAAVVGSAMRYVSVIVVDDGSTDDTAAQAEMAGATVIRQGQNGGKGAALRTGFRHALELGADAVITLDGDGQHDPDEIPTFVAAYMASQPALVIGRRDFSAMPIVRRISNTVGGRIISAAIGRSVPDNQSGYRLVDRRLMTNLLDSRESGFEFEVEMIARCVALGRKIQWVPIRTIYAGAPSHIRPWRHLRSFIRAALDARRIVRGG